MRIHRMQVVERLDPRKDAGKGRRQRGAVGFLTRAADVKRKRMFFLHENTPFFRLWMEKKDGDTSKKCVKASMTPKQMAYSCGFLAKIIFLKNLKKGVDILKEA